MLLRTNRMSVSVIPLVPKALRRVSIPLALCTMRRLASLKAAKAGRGLAPAWARLAGLQPARPAAAPVAPAASSLRRYRSTSGVIGSILVHAHINGLSHGMIAT